jgi:hypothetical protein
MRVEKLSFDHSELVKFLEKQNSSIFNQIEWSNVLREGFNSEVFSYCLVKDGRIVLALPGIILDFKILKMFYSNIPYGGFVGEVENTPFFLKLLEKRLKEDHIHLIRIGKNFQTYFPELEGYRKEIAYTHLIDLNHKTEEMLWAGYKKRVRRDVRKAEKSGVKICEVNDSREVDILFDIYLETMKRNKAYNTWTRKALHSINHYLAKKRKAKILLAKFRDEIIAGVILLFSPDTTYYFFAASREKYLSLCPNDLLVHYAICLTIREGRRFFDLMSSQKEDVHLMNFKEKWGAQKYPFYFYEKSLNNFRVWLWRKAWGLINTPIGAQIIRWCRGR